MLTKDQASVVADQLIVDAKNRNDRRALARLEARGGTMPRGISLDQFKDLVAQGESRLIQTRQFTVALAALVGLLGVEVYFHALSLVVATIPAGFVLMRQFARKLVSKFVRDRVRGDA